ncbi:MAG: peptidase M17 [Spirochaetales bacterium]|nr:peptidase M17 [Spirochaetales bacterium]
MPPMPAMHGRFDTGDWALNRAAEVAIRECLAVRPEERVLIVTNPYSDVMAISEALYNAVLDAEGRPTLLVQPLKAQLDFADEAVYAAIASNPDVVISMSEEKLGKDRQGIRAPYHAGGKEYDSLFHLLLYGKKSLRAFWSPRVTREIFARAVAIDYAELKRRCAALKPVLDRAEAVTVTSGPAAAGAAADGDLAADGDRAAGTNLWIGLAGRQAMVDDGDFGRPGSGGNLPAGEVFISPELGTARGRICFDGSVAAADGVILPRAPIEVAVEDGFVVEIRGAEEAQTLRRSLRQGEERALAMEQEGALPAGQGAVYARNAYNLGELGIGLNPAAGIVGNVINDEKAYGTCHIAIGHNYDEDAPALIHLDGLIRNPTIRALLPGGREVTIMENGALAAELERGAR